MNNEWREIIHDAGLSLIESDHSKNYKHFRKDILLLNPLRRSGVYIIIGTDKSGSDEVLYVGGCVNISKRLRSHDLIRAIVANEQYTDFRVYSKATSDFINEETILIWRLNPKYNVHKTKAA